ncbi:MAG TPA: Vms1/Ankzf1 family peptidyl-tRNA hydrolase, partial [Solirubrobacteraceae bacterium]|nr:Vms1/Ankzf1 family peptidyl-tRNA hydrolase [Solirubrobacteraceae bacterium]
MQLNEVTPERLRRLAGTRPEHGKVLSVFLNLDPTEFATPPARDSEVSSLLDRAGRLVREEPGLDHEERTALEQDLGRVGDFLRNDLDTRGAHGVAVFASAPAELFEALKLPRPVDHEPVVADTPQVGPLAALGPAEQWCVLLVNRRDARLLCGDAAGMAEVELVHDDVHGQHDQGGWSQARYERSVENDVAAHLKHTAEIVFERLKERPPAGLLIAAPQELAGDAEAALHPYLRERLAGRLELDVGLATPDEVAAAAAGRIAKLTSEREDAALARLHESLAKGGRGAAGVEAVLRALVEQRVEV